MKISLFYELQLPRPWSARSEHQVMMEAIEQIELADKLGLHCAWAVEHHFLEEYAHSSAPEVFLAGVAARTERIRVGHGIISILPEYNHPARVAERLATLDLLSNGRVEFGSGESSSPVEWGGFDVDFQRKRGIWEETLPEIAKMMTQEPYAGHQGEAFSMPVRNVVPKPLQKPHPPIWMACTREESIETAARKGIGALSFSFVEPSIARDYVQAYERILEDEGTPVGYAVNPNLAMVTGFFCGKDEQEAIDKGIDGFHFFAYSIAHYSSFGAHRPARSDIGRAFEENREKMGLSREIVRAEGKAITAKLEEGDADGEVGHEGLLLPDRARKRLKSMRGAIGTPDQIRNFLRSYEEAGADQVILIAQAGGTRHEDICESLELFGREVLPEFLERDEAATEAKRRRLEPVIEKVMARRPPDEEAEDLLIPNIEDYKAQHGVAEPSWK